MKITEKIVYHGHTIKATETQDGYAVEISKGGEVLDTHTAPFKSMEEALQYGRVVVLNSLWD